MQKQNRVKRMGMIFAIAALMLFFSSATVALEISAGKSNHTSGEDMPERAIQVPSPYLGFIRNNSDATLCAEEDNIDIPLYYKDLAAYRIIATHPTYLPTNVVDMGENCTNCRCIKKTCVAETIYDDGIVIVEAVRETPWWRTEPGMNISTKGGLFADNVTYLRIYKNVDDAFWDYPQVFVLYEDGNSRMIPQPPLGTKNVTFGSSVILGFLDIDEVKIDPLNLAMDLTYSDKTTAHVEFRVNRSENIVLVSNITYDTSKHPFARFRSMWVNDGNSDVDHIRTQEGVFPIIGKSTEFKGNWWQFFREIPSIHNTYSPDIRIEVVPGNWTI